MSTHHDTHLNAERIQAFLDGALPSGERRRTEEHLERCGRCTSTVDRWRALFQDLDELPRLVPLEGFQERVMTGVDVPEPRSLAARVRAFVRGLVPSIPSLGHPTGDDLQDLVVGALPPGAAARVRGHVDGCGACGREVAGWHALVGELDTLGHLAPSAEFSREVMAGWRLQQELDALGHLAPSEGFAARVMEGVRIPEPAAAPTPARVGRGVWDRLQVAARRLVPETRRAWAALSGVAVTPVVTVGLVLWAVFSHPSLTPGALFSFLGWKATDLAMAGWSVASTFVLESAGTFSLWEALAPVAGSPATMAAVGLTFAAGSLVSLWVLYRNLIANHAVDGRYAHAQS